MNYLLKNRKPNIRTGLPQYKLVYTLICRKPNISLGLSQYKLVYTLTDRKPNIRLEFQQCHSMNSCTRLKNVELFIDKQEAKYQVRVSTMPQYKLVYALTNRKPRIRLEFQQCHSMNSCTRLKNVELFIDKQEAKYQVRVSTMPQYKLVYTSNLISAVTTLCSSSDEHEVLTFNRSVLPAYYGLLRLCCEHSRTFTHQLAVHSNMKWAFENLTPRINHYPQV